MKDIGEMSWEQTLSLADALGKNATAHRTGTGSVMRADLSQQQWLRDPVPSSTLSCTCILLLGAVTWILLDDAVIRVAHLVYVYTL